MDYQVPWSTAAVKGGAGAAGDNVVYDSATDPNILGTRRIKGWVRSNQAGTAKLVVPDGAGGTIIINGAGAGDTITANTWTELNYLRPAGPHQLILNFATAPTTYQHPPDFRLVAYP